MQTAIFEEREKWSGSILLSAGFHVFLALAILFTGMVRGGKVENWGGATSGDAVSANLVSAVPLPQPQEPTQNILATENKGITQSVPQQVEKEPDAIPIPDKETKHKPTKTANTQVAPTPRPVTPPQDNVVPYGEGGPISGPYGAFKATNTKGGFNFQGGDFGNQYGWYVQGVNRKVSDNWYTTEVGAAAGAKRVYILFDIQPDGSPTNVRVEQSSGVPSLDLSAQRAIQRIDTFGKTPTGRSVSVEFWFDYQR